MEVNMENSILNEYGAIGSLLIDSTLFPEVTLTEDDFTFAPLCEIFRAMRRQFEENGTFDALTIRAEAGQHCTEVTDRLLLETIETTPTAANLPAYVDAVREASLARKLAMLGNELLAAEHAPMETLSHAQDVIQRLIDSNGAGDATTLTAALNSLCDRVERQSEGQRRPCVPSGLRTFDKLLGGGFINGGLHVIGARPAVGKSALALQIALNAAKAGTKVLYISLEMDAEDCTARLVGNLGGSSAARFMFGGELKVPARRQWRYTKRWTDPRKNISGFPSCGRPALQGLFPDVQTKKPHRQHPPSQKRRRYPRQRNKPPKRWIVSRRK